MKPEAYALAAELEDSHWWYAARRRIVVSKITAALAGRRDRARILDYGCGTGSILAALDRVGEAYGLDRSSEALDRCRERGLGRLARIEAGGEVPFADRPFDLVAAFDVLEHLPDDEGFLRRARGWLAPGGLLALTVPAFDFLWSGEDVVSEHLRRYTRAELTRLVERSGYQVVESTYFNSFLFPLQCARAWLGRLGRDAARDASLVRRLPPPLNALLYATFAAEAYVLRWCRLPVGGSIFCLARREDSHA